MWRRRVYVLAKQIQCGSQTRCGDPATAVWSELSTDCQEIRMKPNLLYRFFMSNRLSSESDYNVLGFSNRGRRCMGNLISDNDWPDNRGA